MVGRRVIRPFVITAARAVGPGPNRLRLVKLAHRLGESGSPRVLLLEEALLLQMNDFDRFLEAELRRYLDPVVARRPPPREGRPERSEMPVALVLPAEQPNAEGIPVPLVVEPAL